MLPNQQPDSVQSFRAAREREQTAAAEESERAAADLRLKEAERLADEVQERRDRQARTEARKTANIRAGRAPD